ncbi:MauE/DoxX family redox-associated membrane protein [Streptomyces sp. 4F14]
MFAASATGMAVNLRRGRRIDCGCHGVLGEAPVSAPLVARTLLLAAR